MLSVYKNINRPKDCDLLKLNSLLPIKNTTKTNQLVSVHWLSTVLEKTEDKSKLISYLQSLTNKEIETGNTLSYKFPLTLSEFENYYLSGDAFIVIDGGKNSSRNFENSLEKIVLGAFYIRPNFPGRCSHICNAGFFTSTIHRNQGIGKIMGLAFIEIAPLLGYKAAMFNLVFSNNIPSIRLWQSLGFKEIGRVPNAGVRTKGKEERELSTGQVDEEFVDATMFYYSFT